MPEDSVLQSILNTLGDGVEFVEDVAVNSVRNAGDLATGLWQAPLAMAKLGGQAAISMITDPEESLNYITSERAFDDFTENVWNPIADNFMEYAHPIDKFRKDPLFVVLDAVTLLDGAGFVLGKIGKGVNAVQLSEVSELSMSRKIGRAAINRALDSDIAETVGLSAWAERNRLAKVGTEIKRNVARKSMSEVTIEINDIKREMFTKFSQEETGMFHNAMKGLISPKLFGKSEQFEEALRFYKGVTTANKDKLIKIGMLEEGIFERRSMLPSLEALKRISQSKDIPEGVPRAAVKRMQDILETISKDKSKEALVVKAGLARMKKEGFTTVSEWLSSDTIAFLKSKGLGSGYISDIANTIIKASDFGLSDGALTRPTLAVFRKATGKRTLNIIENQDELLQLITKQQVLVAKQVAEDTAVRDIINYGMKTKDRAGNPLAKSLKTAEEINLAIQDNLLIVAPGRNRFNKLAKDVSKRMIEGVEAGEDIGSSALAGINKILETNKLGAASISQGNTIFAVNKDLARSLSSVANLSSVSTAEKVARTVVDPAHTFWKKVSLGLNPGFVVRTAGDNILRTAFSGVTDGIALATKKEFREAIPEFITGSDLIGSKSAWIEASKDLSMPGAKPLGKIIDKYQDKLIGGIASKVNDFFDGVDKISGKTFKFVNDMENMSKEAFWLDRSAKIAKKELYKEIGGNFFSNEQLLTKIKSLEKSGALEGVAKEVDKWFYNYNENMTHFEKQWVRRVVPFWGFYRHSLNLAAKVAIESPIKVSLLNHMSKAVQDANQFEGAPEWLTKGGLFIGASPFREGEQLFFNARGINPFVAVDEVASIVSKEGTGSSGTVLSALSPLLKVPLEQLMGRELFGNQKRFTSPFVYESPFSNKLYKMDKYSGEIAEIDRVSPPIIEHFMRQLPQYRLASDLMYPYHRYGTSTIFSAEYRDPKLEKTRSLIGAKFMGSGLSSVDKNRYAESFRKQMKMSRGVLERRLAETRQETPVGLIESSIEGFKDLF